MAKALSTGPPRAQRLGAERAVEAPRGRPSPAGTPPVSGHPGGTQPILTGRVQWAWPRPHGWQPELVMWEQTDGLPGPARPSRMCGFARGREQGPHPAPVGSSPPSPGLTARPEAPTWSLSPGREGCPEPPSGPLQDPRPGTYARQLADGEGSMGTLSPTGRRRPRTRLPAGCPLLGSAALAQWRLFNPHWPCPRGQADD